MYHSCSGVLPAVVDWQIADGRPGAPAPLLGELDEIYTLLMILAHYLHYVKI